MSLSVQFLTTLAMIAMGVEVGAALDTYKRFIEKQKSIILFINDFLFWVCQGLLIFLVLLNVNEGELRIFVFLALLCGYAMYQSLFKSIYMRLLERLISITITLYRFLRKLINGLIIKPIIWLLQLVLALCMMIGKVIYTIFLSICKFFLAIISWILKLLYALLPTKIKNYLHKGKEILLKGKGYWVLLQNKVKQWIKKWRS
ncbi:spore cortex biosynthesis protein YabQ [Lottiidibacillus patelloidae]|uniref:Spore cortex biosynthesis protein YabQ n=1 Tax=Lottiidibacillus patelloidae TaxID=2670334 RepID=A0A263BQ20_9BACI|nr:spore cortex biosynthesis protein YabQ [Lottiidibacillus patelloidae]OZM55835.1 spore cortex biosynthesis protein YabQ [Lottiidibacillus patelloidae]